MISENMRKFLGWLSVMLIFIIQMIAYSEYQPQISYGNGRGDDGVVYGAIADQILSGEPISGPAPFVYRIGGPWLAVQYALLFNLAVDEAFRQTNMIFMALFLTLIYFLGLNFCKPIFSSSVCILYSLPWWNHSRLVWFYPVLSELPWLLLMMFALFIMLRWPLNYLPYTRIVILLMLSFLTPIIRETGILISFIWVFSRPWFRQHISLEVLIGDTHLLPHMRRHIVRKEIILSILLITMSFSGIAVTRLAATNTDTFFIGGNVFSFFTAAKESVKVNTVWHVVLSFFLANGGPLLGLPVLYHRYLRKKLIMIPSLVVFSIAIVLLSFIGGTATLRFLSWSSPIFLIILAHLSQKFWNECVTSGSCIFARLMLMLNLIYYLVMIHPFDGFYNNYKAWQDWGGLQHSDFSSCVYLLPCLILMALFIFIGRKIVPAGLGRDQCHGPPFVLDATK